jgi:tetratricopeptide (TPR) repeat protein
LSLERAEILIQQKRWNKALDELGQLSASEPENPLLLSLQARCRLELEEYDLAEESARRAVAAAPRFDYAFYVLSLILHDRGHTGESLLVMLQAVELDPSNSQYLGHTAYLYCDQKKWDQALELAEQGLEYDPKSTTCYNARARALSGLGRASEARSGLETYLAEDPSNPLTHANLGWLALEEGRHNEALEHFQQALNENPELEWARAGLLEALRARNVIYRVLLGYFFWMARLSSRAQWGVIFGGYFAYRFGLQFARTHPEAAPYLKPLFLLYVLFVYLTWTGPAVTNLLLRLSRHGRQLLNKQEILETNLTGWSWLLAAACFIGQAGLGMELWIPGVVLLIQALLITSVFNCSPGWPRKTSIAITTTMSILGLGGYLLHSLTNLGAGRAMVGVYVSLLLFVLLGANYLISVQVKR